MQIIELGEVQERFAEIVWEHAPVSSGDLVKICEKELQWKKPTTYTVLRKLCEKGLFSNDKGTVNVLITREEYLLNRSEQFVENTYDGSLPAFIAAFVNHKKLSAEDAEQIRRMIDAFKEEDV